MISAPATGFPLRSFNTAVTVPLLAMSVIAIVVGAKLPLGMMMSLINPDSLPHAVFQYTTAFTAPKKVLPVTLIGPVGFKSPPLLNMCKRVMDAGSNSD